MPPTAYWFPATYVGHVNMRLGSQTQSEITCSLNNPGTEPHVRQIKESCAAVTIQLYSARGSREDTVCMLRDQNTQQGTVFRIRGFILESKAMQACSVVLG